MCVLITPKKFFQGYEDHGWCTDLRNWVAQVAYRRCILVGVNYEGAGRRSILDETTLYRREGTRFSPPRGVYRVFAYWGAIAGLFRLHSTVLVNRSVLRCYVSTAFSSKSTH